MDRPRKLITLGAALACLATSALAQAPSALREIGWLAETGLVEALASEPHFDRDTLFAAAASSPLADHYASPADLRADLETGEALFKTPLLLGGQAAKAGLSCHSCHVNGRGNPHFQFPAISGDPGTADTTHSFFSETLGNGVFDPVAIPDLTKMGRISHDPETRELERFIETIVVKEFSGQKPVQGVIAPLAAFVRALRLAGPGDEAARPRSATRDLAVGRMMVRQARRQLSSGNPELANLLLSGARDQLSVVYERLIPGQHDAERAWLVAQSRALARVQVLLREEAPIRSALATLGAWDSGFETAPDLARIEAQTLYSRAVIEAQLASGS